MADEVLKTPETMQAELDRLIAGLREIESGKSGIHLTPIELVRLQFRIDTLTTLVASASAERKPDR